MRRLISLVLFVAAIFLSASAQKFEFEIIQVSEDTYTISSTTLHFENNKVEVKSELTILLKSATFFNTSETVKNVGINNGYIVFYDKNNQLICGVKSDASGDRIAYSENGKVYDVVQEKSNSEFTEEYNRLKQWVNAGNGGNTKKGQTGNTTRSQNCPVAGTQRTITVGLSYISSLKTHIDEWKECRNGAFNQNCGTVIYGTNGYFYMAGIAQSLKNKLAEINKNKYTINDINIAGNGGYVVLFDSYGYQFENGPIELGSRLKQVNANKENLLSACFNSGEWAIVTDKNFYASNRVMDVLNKAMKEFGFINSVFISPNYNISVCCERGVYFHNAPHNLVQKVKSLNYIPKFIKFTDDGLFLITDGNKRYTYFM